MSIEEGNEIIAEFMGLNPQEYDTDWRVLMPVVEKIEKLPVSTWVKIYGDKKIGECEISNENCDHDENGIWKPIVLVQKVSKIEAVYTAVVQFIQWYNSQTLKPISNE